MKTTLGILALAAGFTANAAWAQSYTAVEIDVNTTPNGINDSGLVAGTTLVTDHWNIASYLNPLARPAVPYRVYPLSRDSAGHTQNTVIHAVNQGGLGVGAAGGGVSLRYAINDQYFQSPTNGLLGSDNPVVIVDSRAAWFTPDGRAMLMDVELHPSLGCNVYSVATAVNDAGSAVGRLGMGCILGGYTASSAFLWIHSPGDKTSGNSVRLDCPPGTRYGEATSINNDGLIGGHCDQAPYLWWDGVGYDITSWLPDRVKVFGRVKDMATLGREHIVGCSVAAIANSDAFVVNCAVSEAIPGGRPSYAYDTSRKPADILAFVSTPSQPALTQIPPPSPFNLGGIVYYGGVSAYSINDRGCAVGGVAPFFAGQDYYPAAHDVRHAFKYCPGEALTILDERTVSGGERLLGDYARAINNHDQILVQGAVLEWTGGWNHTSAAYLLTPAP